MSSDPSKNVTFKWFKGTDKMRYNRNKSNKLSGGSNSKSGSSGDSINDTDHHGTASSSRKKSKMGSESKSSKSTRNEIELDESNEGEQINEQYSEQEDNSPKLLFSVQESMSTLIVNPSSLDDFTTYYCYAKNSIGWSNDPCTFNLIQSGNVEGSK